MRILLLLALLLYNIVAFATRSGIYDYEDIDGNKRHSLIDERRNWRKKTLLKSEDHKDWSGRTRHDYDNTRYLDEDSKPFNGIEKQRDQDLSLYRGPRHYEDIEKLSAPSALKSSELGHSSAFIDKEPEKKPVALNCERPHEKYEACFSGCASVTCDNPRDRLRPCYPFCEPGCICVHPYVRDDRTHKCVLPEDCTKGLKGIPDLGEDI
ncbi:uncharacterized protein LOC115455876 [Manduca sexta]|uniref:TIL domain-containing protein n=1 Tax=Manduca sexta TaxID=7130 RepID=A0A921YPQ8_MANSE|nr:uncharacterized protein LOC115455876 [Manduca sexta]KAG6443261.1 hypothetical protein O3G_MSEX002747 [Manduca sexta]